MEGYLVAEPRPLGLSAAIAVGTHTSIVDIIAPASANAGDTVRVEIHVKNIWSSPLYMLLTGIIEYDTMQIPFETGYGYADPQGVVDFGVVFTMPASNVRFHVGSFYWTETGWVQDDYAYIDITLAGVPPAAGAISEMELEYDGARAAIPAYDIPQGERGLVHIWGRNDTGEAQQMGIGWKVRDPDGITVEDYSDWEDWPYTGAGGDHEFIGGRFDLNKVGTYLLDVGLFMYRDDPVMVDEYRGVLCTVGPVLPEPEFRGFALTEYVMV